MQLTVHIYKRYTIRSKHTFRNSWPRVMDTCAKIRTTYVHREPRERTRARHLSIIVCPRVFHQSHEYSNVYHCLFIYKTDGISKDNR